MWIFAKQLDYLSHLIKPGNLEAANHTSDGIWRLQVPTTLLELRSFPGLCNVFTRFVSDLARIASTLSKQLRKLQAKQLRPLTAKESKAQEVLKNMLISPLVLTLPKSVGQYSLDTYARDWQVGCVLLPKQNIGRTKPIGYCCRTLVDQEKDIDTTYRKCIPVVWAPLLLRSYLERCRFILKTDHHSLRWILNLAETTDKRAHWRLRLLEYEFDVIHRAGVKHQAADSPCRLPTAGGDTSELEEKIPVMAVTWMKRQDYIKKSALLNRKRKRNRFTKLQKSSGAELPTISEFIFARFKDTFCKQSRQVGRTTGSALTFDKNGNLEWKAPIDGPIHKLLCTSLRAP